MLLIYSYIFRIEHPWLQDTITREILDKANRQHISGTEIQELQTSTVRNLHITDQHVKKRISDVRRCRRDHSTDQIL